MKTEANTTRREEGPRIQGDVNLNLEVGIKGLVLIGATVYIAAKAGARKAVRKEFRRGSGNPSPTINFFQQVRDAVKQEDTVGDAVKTVVGEAWSEATDDPKQGTGNLPHVDFPQQRKPGEDPPAGVGG